MLPLSRYSIAHMSMGLIYVPCKVLVQDGCLLKFDFYFVEKKLFFIFAMFSTSLQSHPEGNGEGQRVSCGAKNKIILFGNTTVGMKILPVVFLNKICVFLNKICVLMFTSHQLSLSLVVPGYAC